MRNRHYLVFDLAVMLFVPFLALVLRVDLSFTWKEYHQSLFVYTILSILIKLPVFYRLGLYRHLWRYASIEEVSVILVAIIGAAFLFNAIYLLILPFIPGVPALLPRSVSTIDLLLSLCFHGGIRLFSRIFNTRLQKRGEYGDEKGRVLIIGAGNSGTMIAKEILHNPSLGLNPVGFIDDDPRKQGGIIFGIPVLGGRDMIPEVCKKLNVSQILIAMPSASGRSIRNIMKITERLRIKTKTLPGVSELLSDTVAIRQFREVRIDDLLRRDPVKTDMKPVRELLVAQKVLVTGAGGSIGSEICRHIAQCHPSELILLGHGENSIHSIQMELCETYPEISLRSIIADVRDEERIRQVIRKIQPDFIYHAAAHKHVPLMEENLVDAITNNVLGTISMLKCARESGVKNFCLISTDKAVRPRSAMGVTKRMAEIALQLSANGSDRNYIAVRFGNVLGSRGSVIPIFQEQITKGGPVKITHPEMRRYFMTIPEAVQLVLQASTLRGNGEIFVLDMGEPERILDLAIDLIQLSGYVPYKDIDIVFTGLRPGEKLNEQLFREGEIFTRSRHEKIFSVIDPSISLGKSEKANGNPLKPRNGLPPKIKFHTLEEYETYIRKNILSIDHHLKDQAIIRISEIVPEFEYHEEQDLSSVEKEINGVSSNNT